MLQLSGMMRPDIRLSAGDFTLAFRQNQQPAAALGVGMSAR
jgi:hypothetical protein